MDLEQKRIKNVNDLQMELCFWNRPPFIYIALCINNLLTYITVQKFGVSKYYFFLCFRKKYLILNTAAFTGASQ